MADEPDLGMPDIADLSWEDLSRLFLRSKKRRQLNPLNPDLSALSSSQRLQLALQDNQENTEIPSIEGLIVKAVIERDAQLLEMLEPLLPYFLARPQESAPTKQRGMRQISEADDTREQDLQAWLAMMSGAEERGEIDPDIPTPAARKPGYGIRLVSDITKDPEDDDGTEQTD